MKRTIFAALIALALSACQAYAQSSPGLVYGQVPTAAQWNSYFSSKMDYSAGGIPIASGGTGATTASGARTNLGIGTSAIYPVGTSGVAIPLLSTANTWAGVQTFGALTATTINGNTITTGSGTLSIGGLKTFTTSNTMTLAAGADGQTFTFPSTSATVARTDAAQSFTGLQTFAPSGIALLGSSTGYTTITSANAGASNYTLTVPAATDTVATLAAAQTLSGKTLTNPAVTSQTLPVTATAAWDFSLGGWGTATLVNSITTLTFANPPAAGTLRWQIVQGGTGSYTIAWPASVKWPGGTAPTLSTAVGTVDVVTCHTFDSGTTYDCAAQLDFH